LKDTARDYFIGQNSNSHQFSSPLDNSDPLQPSALNIRKQRRLDRSLSKGQSQPPRFGLPKDNLLQIPQQSKDHKPSLSRSDAKPNLMAAASAVRPADTRRFSSNNPYQAKLTPQVVVSHHPGDEEHGHRDISNREPLEREVSKALRRASNYR
jgi:hypothetical protein